MVIINLVVTNVISTTYTFHWILMLDRGLILMRWWNVWYTGVTRFSNHVYNIVISLLL